MPWQLVFRSRAVTLLLAMCLLPSALCGLAAAADNAFDLSGPQIQIRVTRAGKTLPIAEVPNLQPGDRLWLHAVLPPGQSVHFLLIAAFLRGTTNPPPDAWFIRAETWSKQVSREGVHVTVPEQAEQALIFLAPVTGGDFDTLRSAVRAKPGQFVRAIQDLDVASLNRSRLEKYLDGVQDTSNTDPKELHARSVLLARSLNIKIDEKCFDQPRAQQASCLTQNSGQLVLEDQHTESMVAALTTGSASDLIGQVSTTPMAGGGAYSPYIGAIVDVVRIMGSIHTAHYQYLPALAVATDDTLSLMLNAPPSFENPKSVLVIGLPPVSPSKPPPLRAADSKQVYCLQQPSLVLPVDGAPLVFATGYAHAVFLRVKNPNSASAEVAALELPATPDPARGGFQIDASKLGGAVFEQSAIGGLHGAWGFDSFDGPSFTLQSARDSAASITTQDRDALIVGHDDTLHVRYANASCIDSVTVKDNAGKPLKTSWKADGPGKLDVQVPLDDATPGKLSVVLQPYPPGKQDVVPVDTYADAATVQRFLFHAGDAAGRLVGTRLDQVASLKLKDVLFLPPAGPATNLADASHQAASSPAAVDPAAANPDGLLLAAQDPKAAAASHFTAGEALPAVVTLKDGRELKLDVVIGAVRPSIALLNKSVLAAPSSGGARIRLGNIDDLPQTARLSFFLTSQGQPFPRDEKIEVATSNGDAHTELTLAKNGLTLQDEHTVVATLDPGASFGASAFGPLRFRAVAADGTAGDWQPLANLVRVPELKNVQCPDDPSKPCQLNGADLFLIESISASPAFDHATPVPAGMADTHLAVPRPDGTLLYLKLRDDPSAVNTAVLPVVPE